MNNFKKWVREMKKNKFIKNTLLFILFFSINSSKINCGGIIDVITKGIEIPEPKAEFAFGEIGKAEQQLKELRNELSKSQEKNDEFKAIYSKKISDITTEIKKINNQIIKNPQNLDFLNSKLEILQETYQDIKSIQASRKQRLLFLEEHIKILENYLKDPNFKDLTNEFNDPKKFYSFDDLQKINELNLAQEEKIKLLEEQKQNSEVELKSFEQSTEIAKENYEKKLKERESFKKNPDKIVNSIGLQGLNKDQKLELLNLQENLLKNKKELNEFKIFELKNKLELAKSNIFLEDSKINIFKRTATDIKPTIKISEASIKQDKSTLEKQKTEIIKNNAKYKSEINKITLKHDNDKKQLEKLSKEYKVKTGPLLDHWETPAISKQEFNKIMLVGNANENVHLSNKEKDLLEAQIEKQTEELTLFKINSEIKETFYKIEKGKFASEKEIQSEIKKYNKTKLDITAKVAKIKEKINVTKESLKNKNKALENHIKLKSKFNGLNIQKQTNSSNDFSSPEVKIKQQIKYMQDTIDIYENIITMNNKMEKETIFISSVLDQLVGKWYRPAYAIKFDKIPSIIPELKLFVSDLLIHFYRFGITSFIEKVVSSVTKNYDPINLILMLIFALVLIFFIKIFSPKIVYKLTNSSKKNTSLNEPDSLLRFFSYTIAFIIDFISKYIFSISIWLFILFFIDSVMIPDRYITIIFYFASIIYLIYLANRALKYFLIFNKKYNLLSFADLNYQKRLTSIVSIIIYSTIFIQLFRKAFELGIYYQSELPAALSALNWIIGQIALILLMTKELVKKAMPKKWNLSQEQFNNFYYFVLLISVIIIVMANPYIGLGRLLLFVIQRILLSMIMVIGLIMLHKISKNLALKVLFKSDEETILSRFSHGKIVYGAYIIISFLLLIFIGIIAGSYIWDLGISSSYISSAFAKEIFFYDNNSISANSIFAIIGFIFLGIIFASLINKYVLTKIFDLLLVETGIQLTTTTIIKYLFIIIFAIIGFNFAGLGGLVKWFLTLLLVAIGWMMQEPLKDLIYYFIIIIQRPLKIGDYVRVRHDSQDVDGVVRKINTRTVTLKSRNSESISIPNSKLLTNLIVNFNYNTRFIAFDDINITIGFKYDPEVVKKIIADVLDNHPNILKSPRPVIRLDKFGDYGFIFSIRGFLSAQYTLDMWDISSDLKFCIAKALKENHIEIAVPISVWKSVE